MPTVSPGDAVASFDSASAFLESLARALQGKDFPHLGQSRFKVPLVHASRALPLRLRQRAYAIASGREGVPPDRLGEIDLEQVAAWVTAKYPARSAAAVLLGSSNGALTHLAAACGIPWLPQTLLIPVRRPGVDPRDYRAAAEFGGRHAPALLDANPGVELHHMHDANQDALSASQMAYFRVKWRELPDSYLQFLNKHLHPGAPLLVVRDTSTWPVTRYGERHFFQTGAQGGMNADEYLDEPGAPVPDDTAAEAEWGFADALLESIRAWADDSAHPVVEIRYEHPQHPAAAVADTTRAWLRDRGESAERLLVSSFVVHDPWRTLTSASVPFWTFFPVQPAAADLAAYLGTTAYDDIDVMLFSHGVESRGLADAATWQRLAGRARIRGRLLGVDARAFPADFPVFVRYARALRSLPEGAATWLPMTVDAALAGLATDPRITVEASA
ncbi:MAG TPA: hypothetical protein VGK78_11040 [Nocardioides sp.]|uniref:hypothetical protein n=1 Tax=Nocardioides sp. TaxID=35761 RepID=UPI002F3E95E8